MATSSALGKMLKYGIQDGLIDGKHILYDGIIVDVLSDFTFVGDHFYLVLIIEGKCLVGC